MRAHELAKILLNLPNWDVYLRLPTDDRSAYRNSRLIVQEMATEIIIRPDNSPTLSPPAYVFVEEDDDYT